MTLRELRYLIALADRAHFGRATEDCHISQPTLSTQMRKLEEYLGVSLIERNAKSVSLTPIGEEVVRSARQIVAEADALLARTRVPRAPLEGRQALAACGRQAEPEEGSDDFRAVSLETICQLVSAGLGCPLLPALAAQRALSPNPSLAIRPMHSRNDSRRIGLVWRRGYPRAGELELLASLVRENTPAGTRPVRLEESGARV